MALAGDVRDDRQKDANTSVMSELKLTRAQVRRVDQVAIQDWGIPGLVLMENAGRGVADVLCGLGIEGKVVVACAKGNNGGDGFVIARHLNIRGVDVEVILCCEQSDLQGDAAATFAWLRRCDVPVRSYGDSQVPERLRNADWVVDSLLGTGASGAPRSPMDSLVREMNASAARKMAVDLPTGLDCDTGEASDPTFTADHTCTFVAEKVGMSAAAAKYLGEVHCLDIGVPQKLVAEILRESNWPN